MNKFPSFSIYFPDIWEAIHETANVFNYIIIFYYFWEFYKIHHFCKINTKIVFTYLSSHPWMFKYLLYWYTRFLRLYHTRYQIFELFTNIFHLGSYNYRINTLETINSFFYGLHDLFLVFSIKKWHSSN